MRLFYLTNLLHLNCKSVIIKLYKQMERDINDKTNYTEKLAEDTDSE
ncbi:hypothetical protein LAPL110952_12655 [Lactiplantibacillus plajomi]|jgi:hypothetical protein